MTRAGVLIAVMVLAWPVPGVSAQASTRSSVPVGKDLDALTAEVAAQLRCPVCRQLSVQDSPSDLAQEIKGVIRGRLAAGESPEEVKAYFVSKYGEWILLSPPKRGVTLWVWALPILALGAGAVVLGVVLRSWLPGGRAARDERPDAASTAAP